MEIQTKDIIKIVFAVSGIFFTAAAFFLFYIWLYSQRKKRHREEKKAMQQQFETELIHVQMEVEEKTRQHLAAELHDNIGQLLSLTNVTLASIQTDDPVISTKKQSAHDLVSRSIKELRQLSRLIHGEKILQQGLQDAIQQEMNWHSRSGTHTIRYTSEPALNELNHPTKDLFLFRLLQESLNNILKHAEATEISVAVSFYEGKLCLEITDNGKGINTAERDINSGMGLQNMQKRTTLLNGEMMLTSFPGKGTTITFSIPYP